MLRAVQTAAIVAAPHGLSPTPIEQLSECDVGQWEGLDWPTIRYLHAESYQQFTVDPAQHGYPGGETIDNVASRVTPVLETMLHLHAGQSILVVAHHVVNRTFVAGLLGLSSVQAELVKLDNCGISVVVRDGEQTTVNTLNAAFHLQGMAA
jgi:broad specificity phosphatase PhoE